MYEDGLHMVGTVTKSGTLDSEFYYNLGIDGYRDGYPITGSMTGYASN